MYAIEKLKQSQKIKVHWDEVELSILNMIWINLSEKEHLGKDM